MKVLRWLLLGFFLLLVLFLVGGFLLPDAVAVERSTVINAPAPVILEALADLELWQEWEPWGDADESMEVTFGDVRKGVGASYTWKGDQTGTGEVEIIGIDAHAVHYRYVFNGNEDRPALAVVRVEPIEGESSAVTWIFDGALGANPIDRYLGMLVRPMVETSFEQGLASLKALLEGTEPPSEDAARSED